MFEIKTKIEKHIGDCYTPVALYLKLRDDYPMAFLLESSDYHSRQNSFSYICLDPISSFIVDREKLAICYPDNQSIEYDLSKVDVAEKLQEYIHEFSVPKTNTDFEYNAIFGYTSYDAIPLFEKIEFQNKDFALPLMQYHLFRYIIVFNHFNNEIFFIQNKIHLDEADGLKELMQKCNSSIISHFPFKKVNEEQSNFTDEDFLEKINIALDHCFKGDAFQIVLSRKFEQSFLGDEFNVYRTLRSINPSSYLFYFDYGNFKIFGSSPEAQLVIHNNKAQINPIAGTFKRSGDIETDKLIAKALEIDPKENAEHVMLVDLARNDLSKSCTNVKVEEFKKIEYYSHVIHLVSKVVGQLQASHNPIKVLGETYPAGTLSGAPKHEAMKIIDKNEPESRGFYGGTLGYIGLNGDINHAIFIRSFVSQNNILRYQAGCGIVIKSNEKEELQEIDNKLFALRKAIKMAEIMHAQ
ncbi:MAG: anthranilate synthase component I family protein [Crocinitomicaceae bacterium]|nr:anthranilate synthase component I family protein [Crocinitomicaceae bacterium]